MCIPPTSLQRLGHASFCTSCSANEITRTVAVITRGLDLLHHPWADGFVCHLDTCPLTLAALHHRIVLTRTIAVVTRGLVLLHHPWADGSVCHLDACPLTLAALHHRILLILLS